MAVAATRLIKTTGFAQLPRVRSSAQNTSAEEKYRVSTTTQTNRATGTWTVGVTVPAIVIIVVAAYIAAQMLADIASLKIGVVFGYAVDMGTFIYPITFTLRDVVHKLLGKRNAQVIIITAGGGAVPFSRHRSHCHCCGRHLSSST